MASEQKSSDPDPKAPKIPNPQCSPFLFYDDVDQAVENLCQAFGFEKIFSFPGPDGKTSHAELKYGSSIIMLGSAQSDGAMFPISTPTKLKAVHSSIYLYVEDLEEHFDRTNKFDYKTFGEIQEMFWGDKIYSAQDHEGHFWTFAKRVKEVDLSQHKPC